MNLRCPCCRRQTTIDETLREHLIRCEHCQTFMHLQVAAAASAAGVQYRLGPAVIAAAVL